MIALLILILFCTSAVAQFDADAWPSYTAQRKGREQTEDIYEAINERRRLIGWTDVTPSWWRFQRGNLTTAKGYTTGLVSANGFVDYSFPWIVFDDDEDVFSATWDTLNTEFNTYTASVSFLTWVCYDKHQSGWYGTNVLRELNLPTNYFEYTPWRCLNGNGPFTNDTSVTGRGHGWTNAYTAAGGTNFPAGRDTWYTTDYGWDGLRQILCKLRAVQSAGDAHGVNVLVAESATNANKGFTSFASLPPGPDWASGEGWAESYYPTNYTYNNSGYIRCEYYEGWPYSDSSLPGIEIERIRVKARNENAKGANRSAFSFAWCPDQLEYGGTNATRYALDLNGDAWYHGWNIIDVTSKHLTFVGGTNAAGMYPIKSRPYHTNEVTEVAAVVGTNGGITIAEFIYGGDFPDNTFTTNDNYNLYISLANLDGGGTGATVSASFVLYTETNDTERTISASEEQSVSFGTNDHQFTISFTSNVTAGVGEDMMIRMVGWSLSSNDLSVVIGEGYESTLFEDNASTNQYVDATSKQAVSTNGIGGGPMPNIVNINPPANPSGSSSSVKGYKMGGGYYPSIQVLEGVFQYTTAN